MSEEQPAPDERQVPDGQPAPDEKEVPLESIMMAGDTPGGGPNEAPAEPSNAGKKNAVDWLRTLAALGMFCGLSSSSVMWTKIGPTLPTCPLIDLTSGTLSPQIATILSSPGGQLLSFVIDPLFFCAALIFSAILVFNKAVSFSAAGLFTSLLFLIAGDLNRFQPWLYEYSIIILFCLPLLKTNLLATKPTALARRASSLQLVAILLIAMYLFSGLEKLNWRFLTAIGPWLIGHPAEEAFSYANDPGLILISLSMVVAEITMALALAWKRTRLLGLTMALFMHATILYLLGPSRLNTNAAVWPWNFTQMALLVVCFLNIPGSGLFRLNVKQIPLQFFTLIVVSLVVPALGLFQIADPYPAFALYTGDIPWGSLLVEKSTVDNLPARTAAICQYDKKTGLWSLGMNDWAYQETGAALYSSDYCIRQVAERFARKHRGELVVLRIQTYPKWTKEARCIDEKVSSRSTQDDERQAPLDTAPSNQSE